MSENSAIEWTDHTFNPWEGCQKVGPGCDHCYAETRNARFGGGTAVNWGPGAPRRRTGAANWRKPVAWNAAHAAFFAEHGRRQRVFCASLADVFDNAVDPQWRRDLFDLIALTPNLDWLLLTKRIGNAFEMIKAATVAQHTADPGHDVMFNVWIGATVVNQEEADRDIPKLLDIPAHVRFLSMEPLLGPVDLRFHIFSEPTGNWRTHGGKRKMEVRRPADGGLHWIIAGGESGPGARPSHPGWYRNLRDQCAIAGVPFLFKQWGEWMPGAAFTYELALKDSDPRRSKYLCGRWVNGEWAVGYPDSDGIHFSEEPMYLVGKKAAGRLLDGVQHDGYPGASA